MQHIDIPDGDSELLEITRSFAGRTVFPIDEIIGLPLGRTATYRAMKDERFVPARGRLICKLAGLAQVQQ